MFQKMLQGCSQYIIYNIMAMSWRVVHFIKENTVEAVPASWVKDINGCFWPPYSGLELKNLIKNCTPPSYDWDLYHSRPIGELYGDLSVAKSKAAQTEETSDLASENERRKIKKKRFTSDSDSDSNPITFNISHKKKSVINEESEESDKENEIVYIPILRKATKENSVASVSKNMASIQTDSVPRTSKEEIPNTVKPQDASKDEAYKRQVLRMLSILNYKMDQIAEDLNNLKINNIMEKEVPVMESLFEKFNFPLNSMEELHNLEIYLENDEKRKEVVIELSRFGGTNPKIMVKRIMEKVFSNELAVQYSWLGFKKKENFSNLILSQIIIKSVMALHTSTSASDVESAIKMWLVKAKERIQKQQQE
ncbi:uncharacterized protein LOC115243974 isoform X1 [Formica exsecta]|uniref:uncharacterized protein LOC115243974 isoform X1 n=2 Tax=Formica exsecta TaxID=72781 RepID=UPI001142C820|nr:uncharacterized protein LOC115243974 isoform X1 [Formica exsecta]